MKFGIMANIYMMYVNGVTRLIELIVRTLENAAHEVYVLTFGNNDIFGNLSWAKTPGLSAVEAMASGLPASGIDAQGSSDIFEKGITGLISTDDLAAFTAVPVLLSTNHELRHSMRKQAAPPSQNYGNQTTTSTHLQHYRAQLDKSRERLKSPPYKLTRLVDRCQ